MKKAQTSKRRTTVATILTGALSVTAPTTAALTDAAAGAAQVSVSR